MLRIFRSWTLQRYVLREFSISFLLALSACTLLMLLTVFFTKAGDYEDFGVTTGQVAMLFPYLLPRALSWAIPPAAMIAVTIVFGRLSAENEILAAQAGGAPLRILAFPLFFCGIALSGFCLWCNQGLLHWGNSTIRNEIFKLDKPEFFSNLEKPGNNVALKLDSGGVVHINWLPWETDAATGNVRKPIHIAYFQNQEIGQTVVAKDYTPLYKAEGGVRTLILTLREAQVFGEKQPQSGPATSANKPTLSDMQSFCKEFTLEMTLPLPAKLLDLGESRGEKGWYDNYLTAKAIKESYQLRRKFMLCRAAELGAQAVAASPADPAATVMAAEMWNETRISSEAAFGSGGARDRAQAEEAECFRKLGLSLLPISTVILGIGLGLLVRKSHRLVGFLSGILVYVMLYYPMMLVAKELARSHRLPLWALFLPNMLLLLIGYGLWRAYERGWLENVSDWVSRFGGKGVDVWRTAYGTSVTAIARLQERTIGFLRKKTDGYVTGSFVGPLCVVLLACAALFTAMDLFQHGEEVIDGVVRAAEPLAGKARTQPQAVLDVFIYYGIRSLEIICDILPLLILVAGMLCVTVLVKNNEHLIFKSSGVPLQRAFRPIIRTTLLVSLAVTALRETEMPSLIMMRDYLKPLVYHRSASPTALAIHTYDADGRAVMFQMSKYLSGTREGSNLRIYELKKEGRMPVIMADRAVWNGTGWTLIGDPTKQVADPKGAPRIAHLTGYQITPTSTDKGVPLSTPGDDIRPIRTSRTAVAEWHGAVTPSFLESERLGAGVMSLVEISAASKIKPELKVEWWRRISEWSLAVFLLWMTIPLVVSEARSPLVGVAISILLGAVCWFLNMACAEAGRSGYLPPWAPLIPPGILFVIGSIHYYRKMPT
jgi:lipopolysaccharide export LptBFGC system permease protein LptF